MSERTTLAVVASTLPVGGSERVLETLAHGLPSHGIDVDLVCLREPGELGARIAEDTGRTLLQGVAPSRFSPGQIARVAQALRAVAADVVLVLDHANALLYGGLGARRAGIRATFTPIHSTRKPDGSPSLGRIDRWTVRLSRRVVALSPRHARYVHEGLGVPADRIVRIPNGVDTARFSPEGPAVDDLPVPPPGQRGLLLGMLAALRPEKNHAFLLDCLARIERERRPHLVVIGDGPSRPQLMGRSLDLGLAADVTWLGTRHDVPELLRSLDAVVLPSRNVVETFPVSVLEAMACARPVVVSDVGAVRDMVADGVEGRVVPSGDPRALTEALLALQDDPELRRRMGEAGRQRVVDHFTRERMISSYAELVHALAEDRPPDLPVGLRTAR